MFTGTPIYVTDYRVIGHLVLMGSTADTGIADDDTVK